MAHIAEIIIGCWITLISFFFFLTIKLTYYEKERDKVPVALEQMFLINGIIQLLDLLTLFYIGKPGVFAKILLYVCNYGYFVGIAFLGMAYCYYYDCVVIWYGEKTDFRHWKIVKGLAIAQIICVTVNLFTGWFYQIDVNNVYHRDFLFPIILIFQFAMLICIICQMFHYMGTSLRRVIKYHLPVVFILVAAAIYQGLFYGLALIDVAMSFVMIILYAIHMKEAADQQERQAQRLIQQEKMLARQKLQLEEAREMMMETQLRMLNAQLKPHFVYNTIALIRSYCYSDPEVAADALGKFAKFLRGSVSALNETECVDLNSEMNVVRSYIYLQEKRFGERLIYEEDIKEENFTLPALTIQTLVENAVLHGIQQKEEGGKLKVETYRREGEICISITDTGEGFESSEKIDTKKYAGIEIVRERLGRMCGGVLTIESELGKGTKALVVIPDAREDVE